MNDPRIAKLAKVLTEYSAPVREGVQVMIQGTPLAQPLVLALYREVLRRGGHPLIVLEVPGAEEIFFQEASDAQLEYVSPVRRMVIETFDVLYNVLSEPNTRALTRVDPSRQARRQFAHRDLFKTYAERSARGDLKWCLTLYPTHAYAQDAEMGLQEYEDFVFGAGLLDDPDPVARWREVEAEQQRLVDWLKGRREVRVVGPNCDLRLDITGRTFINACGKHNFPDGEIFTSPVEDSAEGWIRFTYPAITNGREVEGITLRFSEGQVVEAKAEKGEEFLHQMLAMDPGAKRLGEFAIGTNRNLRQFTRNILFDEKLGGTIHLAVGRGFPEAGGRNESALHWDMICDMQDGGEIWVDGTLFYKGGEFQV